MYIHWEMRACADYGSDEELRGALEVLGCLDASYESASDTSPEALAILDPTHILKKLAFRIGRSVESWKSAWAMLEDMDRSSNTPLTPSHLNIMIAALGYLDKGADMDEAMVAVSGTETDESEGPSRESDAETQHETVWFSLSWIILSRRSDIRKALKRVRLFEYNVDGVVNECVGIGRGHVK
jgi:hypothetical protein